MADQKWFPQLDEFVAKYPIIAGFIKGFGDIDATGEGRMPYAKCPPMLQDLTPKSFKACFIHKQNKIREVKPKWAYIQLIKYFTAENLAAMHTPSLHVGVPSFVLNIIIESYAFHDPRIKRSPEKVIAFQDIFETLSKYGGIQAVFERVFEVPYERSLIKKYRNPETLDLHEYFPPLPEEWETKEKEDQSDPFDEDTPSPATPHINAFLRDEMKIDPNNLPDVDPPTVEKPEPEPMAKPSTFSYEGLTDEDARRIPIAFEDTETPREQKPKWTQAVMDSTRQCLDELDYWGHLELGNIDAANKSVHHFDYLTPIPDCPGLDFDMLLSQYTATPLEKHLIEFLKKMIAHMRVITNNAQRMAKNSNRAIMEMKKLPLPTEQSNKTNSPFIIQRLIKRWVGLYCMYRQAGEKAVWKESHWGFGELMDKHFDRIKRSDESKIDCIIRLGYGPRFFHYLVEICPIPNFMLYLVPTQSAQFSSKLRYVVDDEGTIEHVMAEEEDHLPKQDKMYEPGSPY